MSVTIHIKNMVCPRCITSVEATFEALKIEVESVSLGEVKLPANLDPESKSDLEKDLLSKGFALLEDQKSKSIEKIKELIISQIHRPEETRKFNFSEIIAENLNQEYSALSKLFSSVEGITIEKYIVKQKIEKVKELLFYGELTLSQISYRLSYSSVSYLSSQFKKETGMTVSEFKKLNEPRHRPLDSI